MNNTQRIVFRCAVMTAASKAAFRAFLSILRAANSFSKQMNYGDTARINLEVVLDGSQPKTS